MGKINKRNEVDIIPVIDISSNSPRRRTLLPTPAKRTKMLRASYLSDPTLVPRVQKYLESNVDKSFVDINVMADDLQVQYREYAKRKRTPFRASVKKAYQVVLKSYGLSDKDASTDEEEGDDGSDDDVQEERLGNSLNNTLTDMYNKRPQSNKQMDESEAIDISSDDSDDSPTMAPSNKSSSNGPSTSQQSPVFQTNLLPKKPSDNLSGYFLTTELGNSKKRKVDHMNNSTPAPSRVLYKKKKQASTTVGLNTTTITLKDIGGMTKQLTEVCKLLLHIQHPELYRKIGISPPRGFLLHGPPGCGKTLLANAIAGELKIPLIKVAAPELVAGVSGESEERIRELFERALNSSPCVLFIDEIDAITQNRQNAQKEMEKRIVAQLLACLDDLNQSESGDRVLVVGATNRPDSIDPALRRAGRFDREICLGIPDVESRAQILKVLTKRLKLSDDFDYDSLARFSPGFVGADLLSLTREAAMIAVNRKFNEIREARKLIAPPVVEEVIKPPVEEKKDVEETAKANDSNNSVKSDAEIIVDDDASKDETAVEESSDAVVVIDDENNKPEVPIIEVAEVVINNGEVPIVAEEPPLEPMPVDNVFKVLSPLEELVGWLHDSNPITDNQLENLCVTMDDFASALKHVQPSAKREGFATVPDTTWDDVGSLSDIREELQMAILAPVRHSEQCLSLGLSVPTGVLLCGPPGCGKTLLAKAVANEAGINFISVKGPELLNMYVGESERAVRVCFERARNSAPCVIFFDELDALCPKRSDSREGGATMRVVNQMLTEMDGIEGRQGVFILAASNRPDIIDSAVLRPGRLDKIVFVGLPSASDRCDILRAITKNGTRPQLSPEVDLSAIGISDTCRGYTGADLAALVREAGVEALKEFMVHGDSQRLLVTTEHFTRAVAKIRPSVSEKDQKHYEKLRKLYSATPAQTDIEEMEYS